MRSWSWPVAAFALIAIIGILPMGLQTQRDNREETLVNQDARLLIEARNEAESVIQATEKVLHRSDAEGTASELFEPGERDRIDAAIIELKQVITGTDRALVQQKTRALNEATQRLAETTMNRTVREALAGRNVKDV